MFERMFTYFWSWYEWVFPPAQPELEMFFKTTKPVRKYSVPRTPVPLTPPIEACYSPPLRPKIRGLPPLHPRKRRKQQHLFLDENYLTIE